MHPSTRVKTKLFGKGFDKSYTIRTWHGENSDPDPRNNDTGDQVQYTYFDQGKAIVMTHDASIVMMIMRPLSQF